VEKDNFIIEGLLHYKMAFNTQNQIDICIPFSTCFIINNEMKNTKFYSVELLPMEQYNTAMGFPDTSQIGVILLLIKACVAVNCCITISETVEGCPFDYSCNK
jgi:hypothetical protein